MNDSVFVDSNLWLYAFIQRPGEEAKHRRALILVDTPIRYTISTQPGRMPGRSEHHPDRRDSL